LSRLELVMVVTNFDPLEDVPELLVPLVPETAPAENATNPLDGEAPLDGSTLGTPATGETAPGEIAPSESIPGEGAASETEGGQ
jgi:hypothetical protein